MHARWASYFEQFNFVIHHKSRVDNKIPDALSQRVSLLISLQSEVIGLDLSKELYKEDEYFAEIWERCSSFIPHKISYPGRVSSERKSVVCTNDFFEGESY